MEANKIISPLGCSTQLSPLCTPPKNAPVQPLIYTVVTASGPVRAVRVTPCVRGGVLHDQTRPTVARRLFAFEDDVQDNPDESEAAILNVQSEHDAMIDELEEKDIVIKMQAEQIKVLQDTASKSDLDIFEVDYWRAVYQDQLLKFNALYSHCCNLAMDIDKKDEYISALVNSEEIAINLYQKQKTMTISLLALTNKERKSKFILGDHKITYATTAPTEALRDEMESSAIRKRGEVESAFITKIIANMDRLAMHHALCPRQVSQNQPY